MAIVQSVTEDLAVFPVNFLGDIPQLFRISIVGEKVFS